MSSTEPKDDAETRILRTWTPRLLRAVLVTSMLILLVGVTAMAVRAPGYYVMRFAEVRAGHLHRKENVVAVVRGAVGGDPHDLLTAGLFALTLVPLVRVVFCFALFVKERDLTYVILTAYVLLGLCVGAMLGAA